MRMLLSGGAIMSDIALKHPELRGGYYQNKFDSVWERKGYLGARVIA